MIEAQACMADLPGSTEVVIALWPELQKAGRHADAQRLLGQSLDFHEACLAKYPDSPSLHNAIAWTLARCHRDLDRALALSQRSVELDPDNPAFVDTLADVYLQLGQTQKAIDLARRCVELDPVTARRKDRLKEFLRPAWQPRWLYDIGG
jgi:predicted Zn-dependent protease